MTPADGKKGLGRGLSSLLGAPVAGQPGTADGPRGARNLPVGKIHPGRFQPRRDFDQAALAELAQSIRTQGVLAPILVRRDPKDPASYELIAGERRWRAAQLAQLHEIPAVVKDLSDREALEAALVENLQRRDLNAIEEALGYRRLMDEMDFTQERVAESVGKSRPHVANTLRLLDLPASAQKLLSEGKITAAHARVALAAKDPALFAEIVAREGLSVREAEARLKAAADPATKKKKLKPGNPAARDADTRAIERRLTEALGLRVELKPRKGGSGELVLHYSSLDQFDDVLTRLERDPG
ncbi:MAG: ParB/RepB/Spo0J family partition protein [Alphaproteobacteria bacterium]|nr:ParB/RepB/Spo0J family partition protein [Alphaproteobacteria bacterium]